jgi:monomeric isocitrate dehydrogenase
MTDEQKQQIAGEIENEGFEYWLINYASKSLPENNAPQHVIDVAKKAADALEEAETVFEAEGLFID